MLGVSCVVRVTFSTHIILLYVTQCRYMKVRGYTDNKTVTKNMYISDDVDNRCSLGVNIGVNMGVNMPIIGSSHCDKLRSVDGQ